MRATPYSATGARARPCDPHIELEGRRGAAHGASVSAFDVSAVILLPLSLSNPATLLLCYASFPEGRVGILACSSMVLGLVVAAFRGHS